MQASSAFFCSRIWFIRILCSTLQQNNKCKVRTAIEMIAQIKRIGLLALVICICEIRDICGYYIHEHGKHRINEGFRFFRGFCGRKKKDATWCRILSFLSIVCVVVSIPLQLGIAR